MEKDWDGEMKTSADCLRCIEERCTCVRRWTSVTIKLPLGSRMPVIGPEGVNWRRLEDGTILARYTPEQLQLCLRLACR